MWSMRCLVSSGSTILRTLNVVLVLGLLSTSVELHSTSHRQPVPFTELAVQLVAPHPPKPAHFGASLGVVDLHCQVCVMSQHQRQPLAAEPAALPRPVSSRALPTVILRGGSAFQGRLPVSRGPPLL